MRKFPSDLSDLLTPYGLDILNGRSDSACSLFNGSKRYFALLENVVEQEKAGHCAKLLDKHVYPHRSEEHTSELQSHA